LRNVRNSLTKDKPYRPVTLLQAISNLFEGREVPTVLPEGIEKIERVTVEAIRIKFAEEIDKKLLSQIAEEEGYSVQRRRFAPRIMKKDVIVARVGSRSDVDGGYSLYVYLFPPEMKKISIYRKVIAEREGILDPYTERINLEKFYEFNLKVIRLVSRYVKAKSR